MILVDVLLSKDTVHGSVFFPDPDPGVRKFPDPLDPNPQHCLQGPGEQDPLRPPGQAAPGEEGGARQTQTGTNRTMYIRVRFFLDHTLHRIMILGSFDCTWPGDYRIVLVIFHAF